MPDDQPIEFFNALLHYYMPGLDVSAMDDREYCYLVAALLYIRKQESKNLG